MNLSKLHGWGFKVIYTWITSLFLLRIFIFPYPWKGLILHSKEIIEVFFLILFFFSVCTLNQSEKLTNNILCI